MPKRLITGLMTVVLVTALGACFREPQATQIKFLDYCDNELYCAALDDVIREFENQNPSIRVDRVTRDPQPGHATNGYIDSLTEDIAVGDAPDVAMVPASYVHYLAGIGSLQPVSASQEIHFVNTEISQAINYEGERWGAPLIVRSVVLVGNKDLLDERRVSMPNDISELETVMSNLDSASDEPPLLLPLGMSSDSAVPTLTLGKLSAESPTDITDVSVAGLTKISEMNTKQLLSGRSAHSTFGDVEQEFAKGEVPLAMVTTSMLQELDSKESKVSDVHWRSVSGGAIDVDTAIVPYTAAEPEAAQQFVKFLESEEAISLLSAEARMIPADKNVAYQVGESTQDMTAFIDAAESGTIWSLGALTPDINDSLMIASHETFLFGRLDESIQRVYAAQEDSE